MGRASKQRGNSPAGKLVLTRVSRTGGILASTAPAGGVSPRGRGTAKWWLTAFPVFGLGLVLLGHQDGFHHVLSSLRSPPVEKTPSMEQSRDQSVHLGDDQQLDSFVWSLLEEEASQLKKAEQYGGGQGRSLDGTYSTQTLDASTMNYAGWADASPEDDYELEEEKPATVRDVTESIVVPSEVCVLSLNTDGQFRTVDKENYCSATGYKCRLKKKRARDWNRSAHWDKIPIIRDALQNECLYALWVDADTFIATQKPLDDLILKMKGKDIVITASSAGMTRQQALEVPDLSDGNAKLHYNTGVMLWKRSFSTLAFLDSWMADTVYTASQARNRWEDQEAFIMLMQHSNWTTSSSFPNGIKLRVELTTPARFNAFPNVYQYGDWLEHFSGTSKQLYNESFRVEFRTRAELEVENSYIMT